MKYVIYITILITQCDFISAQVIDTVAFQRSIDSFNRPYRSELDAKDKLLLKKVADYKEALDKLNEGFMTDIQKEFNNLDNDYFTIYILTDSLKSLAKNNSFLYDIILDNFGIKRIDYSGNNSWTVQDRPVFYKIITSHLLDNERLQEYILQTEYLNRKQLKDENFPFLAKYMDNKLPYCLLNIEPRTECFCKGINKIDNVILNKLIDKIKENIK